MDKSFQVGQRILDPVDKARGTVTYIGPVGQTKGIWIGVEWDNTERGKHDGSHDGKRYFQTATSTSGSFVRVSKISPGVSFEAAVRDRYGSSDGSDPLEIERVRKLMNAPFVEMVGFDKVNQTQSDFARLRTISVRTMGVNGAGDDLGSMVTNLNLLDIAESLIANWDVLAAMCKQLKRLRSMNVADNRLVLPTNEIEMEKTFGSLQQLIMGMMNYDWQQCLDVIKWMPSLQVLHVYLNRIDSIPEYFTLTKLVELNLNGNPIKEWDTVMKFSKMPCLQRLAVNECELTTISFKGWNPGFHALRSLQVSCNKINDWQSLEELNILPVLSELKCKDNPIVDSEPAQTARQLVIASISTLKIVNGCEVEKSERFGAEIDYLKKHGIEYLEALKNLDQLPGFHLKWPRYQELVNRFGAPEESELRVKDTSLKANLLKVNIVCPDDDKAKYLTKSLPPAMVVSKLRGLLTRLIRSAKGKQLILSYASVAKINFEVPLDNDMRDLFFYNVENGDTIFVRWQD
jgi:Leucine-rich repeat (LRR) protein